MSKYRYAVIDADGHFGNNRTQVYSRHTTAKNALKAARSSRLQVIEGEFELGEIVYGDTIGRIHRRVSS